MTTTPIMTVSDLHKTYGKAGSKQYEALKGINFNVQPEVTPQVWTTKLSY